MFGEEVQVLVNNAGIYSNTKHQEMVIDVNIKAVVTGSSKAIERMKEIGVRPFLVKISIL